MARKSNFTPYGEQIVETFDEDADRSEFVSYHFARSSSDDRFVQDDPAPLFLSSQIEQSRAPVRSKNRDRVVFSSLTIKAGALLALAGVIVFSVMSVENPLAVFENTKASLLGLTVGASNASPSTPTIQAAVDIRTSPVSLREAPTRDEIAAAFRAAHQSQPDIRSAPPPAAQPDELPIRRLSADELAILMKRAKSLIAVGDIAPARLLLERAADAQEASAALLLAQTYDPAVLGTQDMRSITPDPAAARSWYEKAARFGSLDAQQRLAQMQN
jgi:hypothetical protein